MENDDKPKPPEKPKMVLTRLAQEYGLTVADLLERYPGLTKEDIIVD
jgi:uncharacterized protein (DUF433 family)